MKKTFIALLSVLAFTSGSAQNRQIRSNMLESNTIYSSQISKDFRLSSGKDAFYIKNNQTPTRGASNEGFVIYSTSDKVNPIIGYSEKGHFDPNNLPTNVLEFLNDFVKEAEYFETHEAVEKQPISTRAYTFPAEITPFVTTEWGQTEPYNWKCPIYSADRTITGCNATAMAQVMNVFQYPANGTGSFSYTSSSFSIPVSANLADYPFSWDQMLDTYIPGSYTTENGNAVANLLFACGASIEMDYGLDGSSSDSREAMVSLNKNFGYDNDMLYIRRENYSAKEWDEIMKKDLTQGYPIIYTGNSIYGGHAFVIDGYQIREDDSYYHVNWGWEGYCDGYFRLAFLSPLPDEVYNDGNAAIVHIHPDDGSDELTGYMEAQSIVATPTSFAPADPKQLSITITKCINPTVNTYTGSLKIYLVGNGEEYEVGTIPGLKNLPSGYYYTSLKKNFDLSEVPVGSYKLEVRSIAESSSYEVVVPAGNEQQTIVITNGEEPPIVKYTVSYYVDNELYTTEEVEYNKAITLPTNPTKEGYTFSGWSGYPSDLIMPDHDIRIDGTFTKNIIKAESITINKESVSIQIGGSEQLSAVIAPDDTEDKTIDWTSSDVSIATVDATGLVKAIAVGTATITAKTTDGSEKSATCQITVTPILVESVTLNYTTYSLNKEESVQLTATVTPENATNKTITWTSSDEKVATVDATGKVTFAGFGSATITATANDGSAKSASCTITNNATLYQLSFYVDNEFLNSSNVAEGATITLPENPTKQGYTFSGWSGYPENLIMPDQDIRIDGSFTKDIVLATSVSLDKENAELHVGGTVQLNAEVIPADTDNKSVTWSSSDETIATVTQEGLVTAVALGEATITVKTADGTEKSATCKINVTPILVESIALNHSTYSLIKGESIQLSATVTPENATNNAITWTSSDEKVVTVDATGKVSFAGFGSATVTAKTNDGSNCSATCTFENSASIYKISFYVDDELFNTSNVAEGATISLPENPTKQGYTFSGWSGYPENLIMPGQDIRIDGSFTKDIVLATSVSLDKENAELHVGGTVQLNAEVIPADTDNKSVTWSSSDETIATVTQEGLVTAVALGEATITVKTADGTEKSATCKINVTPILVESITLNHEAYTLNLGESVQLIATVGPEDATNNTIVWTSSDDSVITVDDNGLATYVGVGTATVTATAADGSGVSANCVFTSINSIPAIISNGGNNIKAYSIDGTQIDTNRGGIYILHEKNQVGKKVIIKD